MEEDREGDLRVPLISSLFCLFVVTGGIFLVLYVFSPDLSRPWFPIVAMILIGSPWIFWLMTYIYSCMKLCCRRSDRQVSNRGGPSRAATMTTAATVNPSFDEPLGNSPSGGDHHGGGELSIPSSKECEMPLNLSVSS